MRSILYLDQSLSSCGYMVWREDHGHVCSGAWPLSNSSPKMRGAGFQQFFGHLDTFNRDHDLTEIVHEAPVFGAANQGEDELIGQIGLIGIIELFSTSRGLALPRSYAPRTWRTSWFTCDERKIMGARKKKEWKRWALLRAQQYDFEPRSHDQAEAIAICDHDLMKLKITPQWRLGDPMLPSVV